MSEFVPYTKIEVEVHPNPNPAVLCVRLVATGEKTFGQRVRVMVPMNEATIRQLYADLGKALERVYPKEIQDGDA